MSLRPISGASLGLALVLEDDEAPADRLAFELPQSARYTDGGLLGRGGMGEIRSVHDGRLGRTLAIKTPVGRHPSATRQLVAEATLTARLVHPGIVAVHDAGCTPDGRPYYTMPIVHGRSLAEALGEAAPSERLHLVRHFLDACEAIAYAHSQGILHRDLKPSNIMVGRFGETIVVDWGLAGPVGVRTPGVVGTRGYMPPEQARHEALAPAADVFALGVTLREILTGTPDGQPLEQTPTELWAIVERATDPSPAARYPDGRALAQDVAAWFEGRRVAAHRYSLRELLARVWAAHRVPLVVALLAVVGVVTATVIGVRRTAIEHARAQRSEQAALAARERSDRNLARAELAQALEATAQGSWPEAELLAAGALMHGPSISARGVLARFDTGARPRLVRRLALPHCARMAVSAQGDRFACAWNGEIRLGGDATWDAAPLGVRGDPVAMVGSFVMVDGHEVGMVLVDGQRPATQVEVDDPGATPRSFHTTEPGKLAWVSGISEQWIDLDPAAEHRQRTAWCSEYAASVPGVVGVRSDGSRVVVCQDGGVLISRDGRGASVSERMRLSPALGAPLALAFSPYATRYAAVGMTGGSAVVLDLEEGRIVRTFASNGGTPFDMALTDSRLAFSDGRGRVYVWEIESGALLLGLTAQAARVRWLDDGRQLRVIGATIEDWELPASPARPHVRTTGAGVSALSLSPDGRHVLTAHGDGSLRLARLDGSETVEIPLHSSVVKDVEFSPDGRHALAVCAQDQRLHVIDMNDPLHPQEIVGASGLRLAWLEEEQWLLAPYLGGLDGWRDGTPMPSPLPRPHARMVDMESDADRGAVTVLDNDGKIYRVGPRAGAGAQALAERPGAIAVAGHGDHVYVASASVLERVTPNVAALQRPWSGSPITKIALSPDGRRLATGHHDGSVRVWLANSLEPLALLSGHVSRVSALAFDATGLWLVTGSWDGDVRQWSMRALELPPAAVLAEAEAAWGITLDDLLEAQAGESPGM